MTLSALDTELIKILRVVADLLVALIAIWQSETQICRCKKNVLFCFGILTSFYCGYCLFPDCQCDQYHTCLASCSVHLKTWFPFLFWTSPELPWHVLIIHSFIQDMLEEGKDFLRQPFYRWRFPKCIFFKNWA